MLSKLQKDKAQRVQTLYCLQKQLLESDRQHDKKINQKMLFYDHEIEKTKIDVTNVFIIQKKRMASQYQKDKQRFADVPATNISSVSPLLKKIVIKYFMS